MIKCKKIVTIQMNLVIDFRVVWKMRFQILNKMMEVFELSTQTTKHVLSDCHCEAFPFYWPFSLGFSYVVFFWSIIL